MIKLKQDQRGAASMLVVIFLAIILTVLTLGFIRLAINEQRVATDDDLTTRAYYAAESGVEDAKRALRAYTNNRLTQPELNADDCGPPTTAEYDSEISADTDYDVEYTCQLIDLIPAVLEFELDGANETIQVPINAVNAAGTPSSFNRLVIKWHLDQSQGDDGDGILGATVFDRGPFTDTIPSTTAWNHPAMLRMSLMRHPDSGAAFTRADLEQYVAFLNPNDDSVVGNGGPISTYIGAGPIPVPGNNPILPGGCSGPVAGGSGDYACEIELTGSFNQNEQYFLRLTSLYTGTHVQVEIYNGNGANALRYFDGVQAVVDVTGRAGQVFRRVQTTLDLIQPNILPDAAITSLTDICKDFFITQDELDYNAELDTSCTIPQP